MAEEKDNFRDHIATADKSGKRLWVYPTKPKGKLYTSRTIVSWFLLVILFGVPFIKIDGNPLLMLNIIERKFFIFGNAFWPQDFHLFVLIGIALVLFIVLFTAVFGRLFCGWACPQTIFLEMVFRKIEYFIEGNAGSQRRLAAAPLSAGKIFKKGSKHLIFFGLSFLIGNLLLAYVIGLDQLVKIITDPPSQHVGGLTAMILFSGLFYFIFAWFREQACTLVCPYGRLQSVLLDDNSIVIAYDYKRGEPRGAVERGQDFSQRGHCISCDACVKVCPTGIDIRNGTQLECVNCTACIDACNNVMNKLSLPKGLIKYASGNIIEKGDKFRITGRIIGYTVAFTILLTVISLLLINRTDVETTILRTAGTLYEETDDGMIRNLYNLSIVNKTTHELPIELHLKAPEGTITVVGTDITVPPSGKTETVFFVNIEKVHLFSPNTMIAIEIVSNGETLEEIKSNFMGPRK
ncbi:MAG: cytochrome c oxidase accessory protein CcoG [Calditrichaeota bacterium]|nr:MAG: cytochrome c oxidase accessory protein CcoG [Calditrichota bacterium]